uniref:Uncharacterized protein n=1 Tax=Hyaloperonospora arabidopsidis (strain Emoy2) TaxID=559515 RepID=M4BCR3_HYAAE
MVAVGSAPVQYLLIIPRACFSRMRTPRHILLRRWKRRSLFARSGQYSRNIERRIPAEQNTNEQPFTDKKTNDRVLVARRLSWTSPVTPLPTDIVPSFSPKYKSVWSLLICRVLVCGRMSVLIPFYR